MFFFFCVTIMSALECEKTDINITNFIVTFVFDIIYLYCLFVLAMRNCCVILFFFFVFFVVRGKADKKNAIESRVW